MNTLIAETSTPVTQKTLDDIKWRKRKLTLDVDSDCAGIDEYGFSVDARDTHYVVELSDDVVYLITGMHDSLPKYYGQFAVRVHGKWVLAPVLKPLIDGEPDKLKLGVLGARSFALRWKTVTPQHVLNLVAAEGYDAAHRAEALDANGSTDWTGGPASTYWHNLAAERFRWVAETWESMMAPY